MRVFLNFSYTFLDQNYNNSFREVLKELDLSATLKGLVLLDINLPKKTGIEVLKEIRKKSKVPVLMMTSYNDEQYKITAFSSLCDRIYRKTFLSFIT